MTSDKKKTNSTVTAGLVIALSLSVIVVLFVLLFKPLFIKVLADKDSYLVVVTLIPCLVFSAIYGPIRGYLWGKEKYLQVSIVELIEQILKIICLIILFNVGISNSNLPAGISLSIACVLSTLIGFYFYKKDGNKLLSPKGFLKPTLKSIIPLNALRVLGSLLQPFISIVLPLILVNVGISSDQALSQLGIIMGMTFPIITIPTTLVGSLAMALVPKLSILKQEKSNFALQNQIINSLSFTLFCSFMFLPIFSALGVPICELLFHNSQAGVYLSSSAWLIVPMGLAQISTAILNSLGKEKFVFFSHGISGIFVIVSILFLPKYIGIYALLIGMGLQNGVVMILNLTKIRKETEYKSQMIKIVKYVAISVLLYLFASWSNPLISLVFGSVIGLVLCCVISIGIFVLLAYCFNLINLDILLCKLKKQPKIT